MGLTLDGVQVRARPKSKNVNETPKVEPLYTLENFPNNGVPNRNKKLKKKSSF